MSASTHDGLLAAHSSSCGVSMASGLGVVLCAASCSCPSTPRDLPLVIVSETVSVQKPYTSLVVVLGGSVIVV